MLHAMPATRSWKARLPEVLSRLESEYGRVRFVNRFDPMEELVSCILSQHGSDARTFPAFTRLRAAFPDWADLAAAPPEVVIELIRDAGLANNKAKMIQSCLREIAARTGGFSLEHLRAMEDEAAMAWLLSLPGVGPKTASIVLCFALGRHAIPVDTHVYRVSWRLGLIPEGLGEVKAHNVLLNLVPKDDAFRFHTLLIQHGRKTCSAQSPACGQCVVAEFCRFHSRPQKRKSAVGRERKTKTMGARA